MAISSYLLDAVALLGGILAMFGSIFTQEDVFGESGLDVLRSLLLFSATVVISAICLGTIAVVESSIDGGRMPVATYAAAVAVGALVLGAYTGWYLARYHRYEWELAKQRRAAGRKTWHIDLIFTGLNVILIGIFALFVDRTAAVALAVLVVWYWATELVGPLHEVASKMSQRQLHVVGLCATFVGIALALIPVVLHMLQIPIR